MSGSGKAGKEEVSNQEWVSSSDPESRMLKMKDGRTHPGYKAEHVVDLKTEEVVSARVCEGTAADSETLAESEVCAPADLIKAGSETEIKEVAADKGDHANNTLVE